MKNTVKTLSIIFLSLISFLVNGQEESFDDFKTTLSEGKPPPIFTTAFEDKVKARIETATEVDEDKREHFSNSTTYSLNNLLTSGFVLYGDPMTRFVNKVADKLLENKPALKKELQFYVIKANITNALCTEPGVIFITTGLLSQIENEAQLAYVLSHEIVHYLEKHIQHSFNNSNKNELNTTDYEDMVMLSKDHEFEADANALELYHSAGYSDREINTVFDVLMYSYLSFDEITIDSSFFNNEDLFIPKSLYPEEANPILAFEDYDDSKSSHPNIRKRRDTIAEEIEKYDNWGDKTNYIEREEFIKVRDIARFESVRENILTSDYLKALYEIYILEKEFPNNEFLQTFKALAWANINQESISGNKRQITRGHSRIEGQLSLLYGLIKELSIKEIALLTIRQIEDIHQQFPESKRILDLKKESIRNLAHVRGFELNELENRSYYVAQQLFIEQQNDTIPKEEKEEVIPENESKYDRIKRIRGKQREEQTEENLNDENFWKFVLYDLAENADFIKTYEDEEEWIKEEREKEYEEEEEYTIEGDVILMAPNLSAEISGEFDVETTLLFYEYFQSGLNRYAPENRVITRDISEVENFTTEKYNQTCILTSYIVQAYNLEERNFSILMVDYEEMKNIVNEFNTPHLLLITGEYYFNKFSDKAVNGHATYINLKTGSHWSTRDYHAKYKLKKTVIEGFAHLVFSKIR
ncbi:M48 family metallopeptidase [Brumimicrobium aurantiacum]|uniref:Peptidase M48 domain-containing protein n=1 Tax=Brumimicrobium aurantiacum TaxID=1737063 RepID=A0A3E1F161_9FLAO|nr:M48 family metallopeptidase [Brumimicrobium aurantiacum]RFC55562.1 hypothetical protein DXU93_01120 [Brumimicrobium aurantiacum]